MKITELRSRIKQLETEEKKKGASLPPKIVEELRTLKTRLKVVEQAR